MNDILIVSVVTGSTVSLHLTRWLVLLLMFTLFGPIGLVGSSTVNARFLLIDIWLVCGHKDNKKLPRVKFYRYFPCTSKLPAFVHITILSPNFMITWNCIRLSTVQGRWLVSSPTCKFKSLPLMVCKSRACLFPRQNLCDLWQWWLWLCTKYKRNNNVISCPNIISLGGSKQYRSAGSNQPV